MKTSIHIGVSKEVVREAKQAILAILAANTQHPPAINEAMITLRTLCEVKGIVIKDNIFKG